MLAARDAEGNAIATPPWNLALAYERAVRKKAVKLVNAEAMNWVVALKAAWKDPTVKERHFTTPLALYTKRPAEWEAQKWPRLDKGGKKGHDKGARTARVRGRTPRTVRATPEGKPICYRFNNPKEKRKANNCKFEHVCGICFSFKHPLRACNEKTSQDDTQPWGPARSSMSLVGAGGGIRRGLS